MAAVQFHHVWKSFPRHAGQMLLRERLMKVLRSRPQEPFYALRDVSFSVESGESIAIIGHNGAGKSTLLNLVTRLSRPNRGRVEVNGRVAALLELGSGFHPDLTGAENLRVNAALLGLSRKKTRERFDQIVEFSGIGDFINEPLRTYSSGMVMRLAFSVAINVDPDILVIDEVLGVGDQAFFTKCVEKIMDFHRAGKTLLCVSHAAATLKDLCSRGIWLDHGNLVQDGPLSQVADAYLASTGNPTLQSVI